MRIQFLFTLICAFWAATAYGGTVSETASLIDSCVVTMSLSNAQANAQTSRDQLIAILRTMKDFGLKDNPTSVRRGGAKHLLALKFVVDFNLDPSAYYKRVINEFKTWPDFLTAVAAAEEFDRNAPKGKDDRHEWTKPEIRNIFRWLDEFEQDVNSVALLNGQNPPISERIIERVIGKRKTTRTFHGAVVRLYGNFKTGFADSGLPPEKGTKQIPWAQVDFGNLFEKLLDAGIPINLSSLLTHNADRTAEVLTTELKMPADGAKMEQGARRRYGSWDDALIAHGYDPGGHRIAFPRTTPVEDILLAVRSIFENRLPLSRTAVEHGNYVYNRIFYETLRVSLTGMSLVNRALLHFPNWAAVLEAAGIDVAQISRSELSFYRLNRLLPPEPKPTREVALAIKKESRWRKKLARMKEKDEARAQVILEKLEKEKREDIVKRMLKTRRTKATAGVASVVQTYEVDASGVSRLVQQVGEAPQTPEESLLENDTLSNVVEAIHRLEPREKMISKFLLEYLETNETITNRKSLLRLVSERVSEDITWEEVQATMNHLSASLADLRPE